MDVGDGSEFEKTYNRIWVVFYFGHLWLGKETPNPIMSTLD